jgi:hypothetical protein
MEIVNLPNEILENLNNIFSLKLLFKFSKSCKLFYFLFLKNKINLIDYYKLWKIWYNKYIESKIISNIIEKLYLSSSIDIYTYLNLNTSSLDNLDKTIEWNRSYWDKEIWREYFIPRISGGEYVEWNDKELNFLEQNYNIFPY